MRPAPHVTPLLWVLLAACGSGSGEPPRSTAPEAPQAVPRAARMAADLARLRSSLERMQAGDFLTRVLGGFRARLDAAGESAWTPVEGGAIKGAELLLFERQNIDSGASGEESARRANAVSVLERYSASLARHGIELLVVPVPTRPQVLPDRFSGVELPAGFEGLGPATARTELALMEAGVELLDLLPTLVRGRLEGAPDADGVFLERDSHWTPRGAALAAAAVARRLRAMGVERGTLREGVDYELRHERASWQVEKPDRSDPDWILAASELDFVRVLRPDGTPAHVLDAACPVLVAGDSFSRRYEELGADFVSLLSVELGMWVDAIRIPGGGDSAVWRAVGRRDLTGKRLVVWLSSARNLGARGLKFQPLFPEDEPDAPLWRR